VIAPFAETTGDGRTVGVGVGVAGADAAADGAGVAVAAPPPPGDGGAPHATTRIAIKLAATLHLRMLLIVTYTNAAAA
jgi:hypothetical protein